MDLKDLLRAIRKGWWMVVIATVLGACVAIGLIVKTAPTYAATVTFFVNTAKVAGVNPMQSDQYAQQRVESYVQLMSSDRLARLIVMDTQIDESANDVADSISASSPLNTVLLTATVTSTSPRRALIVATSISTEFVKMIGTIDPLVELQVTSGPTLNPIPVAPKKKLDLALGIVGGLVIGASAAILRELLDTSVRSASGLRMLTGEAVLGSIGRDPKAKKAPLVVDTHAKSVRAEAFRQLRTNLQFIDVARPAHVLVVTSAVAGEGKSTTATNLAVIFAETGRRVLLIEADLRRPRLADYLGIERAVGLTNVLAGQVGVDEVLQIWGRGGLAVLPSGSIPPNPSELLGSEAMTELLQELRARFDIIVLDTPPLLPVTDAAVASVQADGAVVVVRYGKTKRTQVVTAINTLKSVDARILGCVLTMAPMKGTDAYLAYDGYSDDSLPPAPTAAMLPKSRLAAESVASSAQSPDNSSQGADVDSDLSEDHRARVADHSDRSSADGRRTTDR